MFAFAPVAGESLVGLNRLNSIPFCPKKQTFPLSSRPSKMSSGPENSPASPHGTYVKHSLCVTEIQMVFLDAASHCVQ